eukprot:gene14597-biopygen15683
MDVPGGISPLELHSSPASCTIPNWHQHRPRSIKISKRILSISYHDLRVVAMTAVAEFYDIIARISIEGRSNEIFNDHTFIINHGIAFNALPPGGQPPFRYLTVRGRRVPEVGGPRLFAREIIPRGFFRDVRMSCVSDVYSMRIPCVFQGHRKLVSGFPTSCDGLR